MDPREQLKSMLQSIINDQTAEADATLHNYLVAKTQSMTGIGAAEAPVVDDTATE